MNDPQRSLRLSLYGSFTLIALVIIADFFLPGKVLQNEIIQVQRELQDHNNAGGNYHYSYKVITEEHTFFVSEDFGESVQDHDKIEYTVSRIFNEVNGYRLLTSSKRSVYSLRILSGLVLPLLFIISILIAYRTKRNIDIFLFVLLILLIADLVFVLM